VVTDRALTSEHSVMCGSSCGFGCCVAGGVQCDRLAGAGGEGRGAVACRPAGSRSACPGQQERESNADLLEETGARLRIHICLVRWSCKCFVFDGGVVFLQRFGLGDIEDECSHK
jgi:hypothetical protein